MRRLSLAVFVVLSLVVACALLPTAAWAVAPAPIAMTATNVTMPSSGDGTSNYTITGIPGAVFCLAIAAIWGYAAWSLYKLEPRGWWLIFIALLVYLASSLLTFARHDMMEMYRLMDYPQAQLEQIQKFGFLLGNRMAWLILLSMLPFLGYLLFIRKYFRRSS